MDSLIFVYCYQILNNAFGVMLKSQPDDQIEFFLLSKSEYKGCDCHYSV